MTLRANSGPQGAQCVKCIHYTDCTPNGGRKQGRCAEHGILVWASARPMATKCYTLPE